MSEFRTLDLVPDGLWQESLQITKAQVLKRGGPLAIVSYRMGGRDTSLGLRLDMDKRVFLDAPDDLEGGLNSGPLPARTADAIFRHLLE